MGKEKKKIGEFSRSEKSNQTIMAIPVSSGRKRKEDWGSRGPSWGKKMRGKKKGRRKRGKYDLL